LKKGREENNGDSRGEGREENLKGNQERK